MSATHPSPTPTPRDCASAQLSAAVSRAAPWRPPSAPQPESSAPRRSRQQQPKWARNWLTTVRRSSRLVKPESVRSEEHTSELQSHSDLVCRLLLEKKK